MPTARTFVFISILLLSLASASRADDNPDPCAAEWKATIDTGGTPGFAAASEAFKRCEASATLQKKTEFAATRDTWAASLDKLPEGGWIFLTVGLDGTYAVFGSRRHATREGNVVAIWFRYENRESQSDGSVSYKSLVERQMYDCARVTTKVVSNSYYKENNLSGGGSSRIYDEKSAPWAPVIPGTLGDQLLDWSCKTVPRAQPAKPQ